MNINIALSTIILLAGCTPTAEKPQQSTDSTSLNQAAKLGQIIIYEKTLFNALQNPSIELQKKRPTLYFDNADEASDCSSYLSRVASVNEGENNKRIAVEYLICDFLKLTVGKAFQWVDSVGPSVSFGQILNQKLKLRSFPTSFGPRISRTTTPIQLIDMKPQVSALGITMENQEQFFDVKVLGVGDLNGNDIDDWLIQVTDQITAGTYYSVQWLVINDVQHFQELLSATVLRTQSMGKRSEWR